MTILALILSCANFPPAVGAGSNGQPSIVEVDPPSPAPGGEAIIRLNEPVEHLYLEVTFDDLNAKIISSSGQVIRVQVPLALRPGSKPWIVVESGSVKSPAYILTAGIAPNRGDVLEGDIFRKIFGDQFGFQFVAIGGAATALVILTYFLYRNWNIVKRREQEALKRMKALEAFRTGLSAAHERSEEAPSAADSGEPPSVPDALVAACAAGECVLFAGTGLEATLGARTSTEVLATLVEAAQDRVPLEVWRTLPTALLQGETERLKELLRDVLQSDELQAIVRADADLGISPTNEVAKLLSLISFAGLITLSWSHFLDLLFSKRLLKTASGAADKRYASVSGLKVGADFFLLRPFGEPGEKEFAFTLREFRDLRERSPELSRFIASTMARNSMLFLGCQVEEIEQFIVGANVRVTTDRIHYAVVPRGRVFGLQQRSMRSAYQIELIGHDPSDPDALGAFINELGRKLDTSPALAVARPQRAYRESPRVDALRLVNIGPFEDVTIPFKKPWTILLANNGSGKSTILKSVAVALLGMDNRVSERCGALLKQGAPNGSIELRSAKETYKVELIRDASQNRVTVLCPQDSPVQSGRWPVFGFPATRGVPVPFTERRAIGFPEPLVEDVLPILSSGPDPRLNDLKTLIIDAHVKSELSDLSPVERARAQQLRDALFSALDRLTPGFDIAFSRIDKDANEVYVSTSDGVLPLSVLSQGITSTFGWAGTVMARLFDIYKDSSNPANEPALLLLDEMDVHLHPSWQQLLAPAIKSIFPKLSVVATSHSPLIVGTLDEGEVVRVQRVGGGFRVEQTPDYRRYRADQILTDAAFGLHSARDPNREQELVPLREEYARLLRTPRRSQEEDRRLADIMYLLEASLPLPGELAAERAAASQGQAAASQGQDANDLDKLIAQMSALEPDQQRALQARLIPEGPSLQDGPTKP